MTRADIRYVSSRHECSTRRFARRRGSINVQSPIRALRDFPRCPDAGRAIGTPGRRCGGLQLDPEHCRQPLGGDALAGRRPWAAEEGQVRGERGVQLGRAIVWMQNPIVFSEDTEPQPDIAVLRRRPVPYKEREAWAEDALLIIEVADSSLAYVGPMGPMMTLTGRRPYLSRLAILLKPCTLTVCSRARWSPYQRYTI
jgi:Putative restriction endonuclease